MIDLSTCGHCNQERPSKDNRPPVDIEVADPRSNDRLRLMRNYQSLKRQAPGALLMFRVTRSSHVFFYEDAVKAAKELEVNLTPGGGKEGPGIPQLVVPSYAADACIQRLLQKGHRVAICDQVKDRPEAEGPARRQAKGKNGRAVNIGEAA